MQFLLLSFFLNFSFGIEQSPHVSAFCSALLQTQPTESHPKEILELLNPSIVSALQRVSSGPKTRSQKIINFLNAIKPETLAQIYEQWRKGHFDLLENYDQTVLTSIKKIENLAWSPKHEKISAAVLSRLAQLRIDMFSTEATVEAFEVRGKQHILEYLDDLEISSHTNDKPQNPKPQLKKSILIQGALAVALSTYIYGHGIGFLFEPLPQHVGMWVSGIFISIKALVAAVLYYLGRVIVYPQMKEAIFYWAGLVSNHGRILYEDMTSQDRTSSQFHIINQMRETLTASQESSDLIYNSVNMILPHQEGGAAQYFLADQILFFEKGEPILINFLRTKNKMDSPK